ncbi:MAG: chitobiase/beta-hexosaminidase C-terminal domain-containing protein, partial [Muribaculaceae bacterium]|nr:chitobiase/beta-hexosaminidase C-terminal domain-containing protein [Muribaculaceae bacterium]
MTIDKVKYLRRHAMLLILLLTGWAAGVTASASTQVTLVPDIGSNLTGTETNTGMQPLESMTSPAQLAMVEFQQYNGNTAPAYYSNGNTIRLYSGNLFTVLSPISYIERIEFHSVAYKSSESTLLTVDGEMLMYDPETLIYTWEGVYSEWGGGLTDVSFLINDTQLRLSKIVVTLAGDIEVEGLPKSPVLSKSTGSFSEDFTLTITDPNSPKATVRYTLDGTEPTASTGTVYTGPITIKAGADVTVKAVAVNADNAVSPTVSATYRFEQKYRFSVRLLNPGGVQRYYLSSNSYYGYWNTDNSILASEGESIWVDISYNTGYRAKSIKLDGNALEQSQNYYFTMPANDTELTIETVFDPNSPSDPQPADTTRYYTLSVVANPLGAASTSGSGKYKEGRNVNVNASARSGYQFTGWTYNGVQWGDNEPWQSLTMPAGDVVLTANYVYNPSSPSEPQQPALKHPLTAVASPAGAATFRLSASSVTYGQQYTVTATPRQGYVLKNWIVNGEPVNETSKTLSGIMTEKGAQVVGLFVFDPSSPDDPGANHYNPSTGQMILDNFKPGSLYQAARRLTDGNLDQVSHLIVKGVMNSTDMEYLRYFNNAGIIDFSRTSGVSSVSSYIFEGVGANTLILPSTVTEMKSYVFNGCDNLTSIVCYAQEPPVCQNGTFSGLGNAGGCTVYVPASAIELYSNADYWKDFTILPITNDAHVLQVNLPEEAADGRYKHNSLEIVNINTGVRQKYVVSDRLIYTFNGLQKDEQYNVYLYSQAGLEIGRIEDVLIPDSDTAVSFMNLRELFTVSALVTDKDGADVTGDVAVEWLKPLADGTTVYLRKSTSLGEIPDGQALVCRVTLPETLATAYEQPGDVEFTVDSDNNSCRIALAPLRQFAVKGRVTDIDGAFIQGASVSAVQTLNGKYQKTFTTKTDRKGEWTLSLLDAPETRITYAASECVNRCDTVGAFDPAAEVTDLGVAALRSIVGARITCGFSYLEAGQEEATDYFDDYRNVTVSVFNLSQNRQHQDVSFQYPLIAVLDENIAPGDAMRLTATSKTGVFNPVDEIVVLGNDSRGDVTFSITGKGGISAAFEMTDNPAVIAMLYSAKGELLKKQTYSEAKTAFTALEDGDYTVISMGQSDLMNSILRLSSFDEIGLTEGKDYVKNTVTVESGKLSEIKIPEVPAFDESLFYYTNSSTSFSSNKSSITTGNYLTLRSTIDFKGVYKNDISNVALVVDMPEACDFVEQSVIQGPNLLPYTLDNNRLTIQLGNNYQSQTRFCVVPTNGGSFNATASVVFDYNGKTLTQPIGSAASEIKDIEISVPSVIAGTTFKVSGTATGHSSVNVYDDGALLGSGKANAAGAWNVECELGNPYNLSTHSIYAEITTPANNTLTSETKELTYDINALQVSKVTMYHWNPELNGWTGKMEVSEFDFLNPKTSATQWTVYYPAKKFTYTIEFTDNDPERISNVILYVHTADGKFVPLKASFDENKRLWYAEIDMGSSSDGYYPVNCSVDFDYISEKLLDNNQLLTEYNSLSTLQEQIASQNTAIDEIYEQIKDELKKDEVDFSLVDRLNSELEELLGISAPSTEDTDVDENELYDMLEKFKQEYGESSIDDLLDTKFTSIDYNIPDELGTGNIAVTTCLGYDITSISQDSTYEKIKVSGDKQIFVKATDTTYLILDFDEDICYSITFNSESDLAMFARSRANSIGQVQNYSNTIGEKIKTANELLTKLLGAVDDVVNHIDGGYKFAQEGYMSSWL